MLSQAFLEPPSAIATPGRDNRTQRKGAVAQHLAMVAS